MQGIGDKNAQLAVYIGNRPPLKEFKNTRKITPVVDGELTKIAQRTGNHWRKIFNIYAKIGFMLDNRSYATWQLYRDNQLLQAGSNQALVFDQKIVTNTLECITIVCGKQHAALVLESSAIEWIDDDFAIDRTNRTLVTPYFDYRQLSNAKLETLHQLIHQFL